MEINGIDFDEEVLLPENGTKRYPSLGLKLRPKKPETFSWDEFLKRGDQPVIDELRHYGFLVFDTLFVDGSWKELATDLSGRSTMWHFDGSDTKRIAASFLCLAEGVKYREPTAVGDRAKVLPVMHGHRRMLGVRGLNNLESFQSSKLLTNENRNAFLNAVNKDIQDKIYIHDWTSNPHSILALNNWGIGEQGEEAQVVHCRMKTRDTDVGGKIRVKDIYA